MLQERGSCLRGAVSSIGSGDGDLREMEIIRAKLDLGNERKTGSKGQGEQVSWQMENSAKSEVPAPASSRRTNETNIAMSQL
jgi:hypothetical protein